MLVILDYGIGNVSSIHNILKKVGVDSIISGDKEVVATASKIIFPGMGAFDNCMVRFNESGLRDTVQKKALDEKTPVLGICVGLQMFMETSEEGNQKGLGWVSGATVKFKGDKMSTPLKIPNMGWLEVAPCKPSKLMENMQAPRFYFAHSFHVVPSDSQDALMEAMYGYKFVTAIEKENLIGVQFHPEKSHRFGMQLLKNFATLY